MKKNFILGVGCQKGGTTWLHSQLEKSSNVDMGFTKEYHVFDALYVPECRGFLNRKLDSLKNTPHDIESLSKKSQLLMHLNFYLNTQNYFDYFDYLWHKGVPDITTVGDITPSYSTLPVTAFREIKSGLEAKGFNIKVVFLMRDPIERCWSMLRMHRKNKLLKNPAIAFLDEEKELESLAFTKICEIRTRYEQTVKNLELVFDKESIFYSLYENFFEDKTINKLRSFLEIPDFSPDINYKANVSKKSESLTILSEKLASSIFNHYRDTYEFCESRFGVKELWPGWKYY